MRYSDEQFEKSRSENETYRSLIEDKIKYGCMNPVLQCKLQLHCMIACPLSCLRSGLHPLSKPLLVLGADTDVSASFCCGVFSVHFQRKQ